MKIGKHLIVYDKDKAECRITDFTSNSVEVLIQAKTSEGINATQWFTIKDFNERFKSTKE